MANQEQVLMLRRSVAEWNQWRDSNDDSQIDLRNANFRGCDLTGANLKDANLRGVDIRGTKFGKPGDQRLSTNLNNADLSSSKTGWQHHSFLFFLTALSAISMLLGIYIGWQSTTIIIGFYINESLSQISTEIEVMDIGTTAGMMAVCSAK